MAFSTLNRFSLEAGQLAPSSRVQVPKEVRVVVLSTLT